MGSPIALSGEMSEKLSKILFDLFEISRGGMDLFEDNQPH